MKIVSMAVAVMLMVAFLMTGDVMNAYSQDAQALSGKVTETMDSGGYTYACIEKNGKKTWVAVPQAKIAKGKNISFQPGMEMSNFESKTLKRKFDKIYFSAGILK